MSLANGLRCRGIIQFTIVALSVGIAFFPDEAGHVLRLWTPRDDNTIEASEGSHSRPRDISRRVVPVGCHSHNDYWRPEPLFSALRAGCIGVEADVWLFDEELYVGHTTSSLNATRTLKAMYIDPLVRLLDHQNRLTGQPSSAQQGSHSPRFTGIYDTHPEQTLILLLDLKSDGAAAWPVIQRQLAPLRSRGYLTFFNGDDTIPGPVTVVGTGNTPFDLLVANRVHRDIFFDAPLDKLVETLESKSMTHDQVIRPSTSSVSPRRSADAGQGLSGTPDSIEPSTFNARNSHYASVSLRQAIGLPWSLQFSQHQVEMIRTHVRIAHSHGLKVRYWGIPNWPRAMRDYVWRVLVREGVDFLNVDDLAAATRIQMDRLNASVDEGR